MDGSQTPGINYNSIDGLTTVNATTIIINGSTINLDSYIPYVGATQTPDFNTKQLKNISIGTLSTDAAAVSQLPSITGLVPYTLAISNVDLNAKQLKNIANGTAIQDAVSVAQLSTLSSLVSVGVVTSSITSGPTSIVCGPNDINFNTTITGSEVHLVGLNTTFTYQTYGQYMFYNDGTYIRRLKIEFNGPDIDYKIDAVGSPVGPIGFHKFNNKLKISPTINTTDIFTVMNAAGTSIFSVDTLTSAISCNTVVNANSNKIINLADGTNAQDAITFLQQANYRYDTIQNAAVDCYVNCGLNDLTLEASPTGTITLYSNTLIQPASNVIDLFRVNNAVGTSIFSVDTLTSAISCNTVVNMTSKKIINLATATNAADAVRYDQLPAALPAGSVQGSYIVYNSGAYINNATNSINLGINTYSISPSSINIGHSAGAGNSGSITDTVNIGQSTGSSGQASQTVAVGSNAGATSQGVGAIAIGYKAQRDNTTGGFGSVSIGSLAGSHDVGRNCVGIGGYAGYEGQSSNSIAIGYQAGYSNQHLSSIIINATGAQLNSLANAAFYVAPVRSVTIPNFSYWRGAQYNTVSKEIAYNTSQIWNVMIAGTATTNPSASVPLVYYMPAGIKIDPATAGTASVVRVSQGYYLLTFTLGIFDNYTTITTGMNSILSIGSDIVTAKVFNFDTIIINYFLANVVARDLQLNDAISLRVEF